MIAHVKGQLVEADLNFAIVDVNGLGYNLNIPMSTYDVLPRVGAEVALRTHMVVREDAMQLFAFATTEERELFRLLLNVSGVGAKTALACLSAMPIETLCEALVEGNIKILSQISGIGKKSAERMSLELRDKVASFSGTLASKKVESDGDDSQFNAEDQKAMADASLALETLGFRADKIRTALKEILLTLEAADRSSENLIREALQKLNS